MYKTLPWRLARGQRDIEASHHSIPFNSGIWGVLSCSVGWNSAYGIRLSTSYHLVHVSEVVAAVFALLSFG